MAIRILIGDCRVVLATLPDVSVDCCVTSPPYFNLRDYGTASYEGGDPGHSHDRVPARGGRGGSGSPGKNTAGAYPSDVPADLCSCGARRVDRQIGLEKSPEAYVAELVAIFREVRRVLRDEGTLWLNLGDSYASTSSYNAPLKGGDRFDQVTCPQMPCAGVPDGTKAKDMLGIPWMVAFALRADGWFLRKDIIWHKPNAMPENVLDRPTSAHEHVFLLTKAKRYFYDGAAIAEEAVSDHPSGNGFKRPEQISKAGRGTDRPWDGVGGTRNARDVWSINVASFKGAHFATMAPAVAERCIRAGCPPYGTVLDPFGGAGTTALVADRLKRDAIIIELNPAYAALAERRISGDGGMFTDVTV